MRRKSSPSFPPFSPRQGWLLAACLWLVVSLTSLFFPAPHSSLKQRQPFPSLRSSNSLVTALPLLPRHRFLSSAVPSLLGFPFLVGVKFSDHPPSFFP